MSTDTLSELDQFQHYLDRLRASGDCRMSLDECVADFRLYQEELERCRAAVREALESSARGEGEAWDLEEMLRRGRERLAEKGITD
jgi:hypothetical protein